MACTKNVSGPAAGSGGSPGGDGGGDPPRRLSAAEKGKGKKLATKKRKASDREAEVAEAVAAAAEAAERGGRSGALRIGDDLTPRQRRVVLEAEARHGSPPGTIMLGGQRVRITVRDQAQEDPETGPGRGSSRGTGAAPQEVDSCTYPGHSSDWYAGPVYLHCSCYTSQRHTSSSSGTSEDTQGSHPCVS